MGSARGGGGGGGGGGGRWARVEDWARRLGVTLLWVNPGEERSRTDWEARLVTAVFEQRHRGLTREAERVGR